MATETLELVADAILEVGERLTDRQRRRIEYLLSIGDEDTVLAWLAGEID